MPYLHLVTENPATEYVTTENPVSASVPTDNPISDSNFASINKGGRPKGTTNEKKKEPKLLLLMPEMK